jgi:hypothetical protein
MTLLQKRIGSALLAVLLLLVGANWLLDWNWFGKFDVIVLMGLVMFSVIYIYIIPPKLEFRETH